MRDATDPLRDATTPLHAELDVHHSLPARSVTREEIADVMLLCNAAPSADNGQPFFLVPRKDGFNVCYRPERAHAALDAWQILPRLTLGTLLESARLAGSTHALAARWTLSSLDATDGVVARVTLTPAGIAEDPLARQLKARRANRAVYDRRPLTALQRAHLFDDNRRMRVVETRAGIDALAQVCGVADAVRARHRRSHEELYASLRFTSTEVATSRDGLDVRLLGLNVVQRILLALLRPWKRMRSALRLGGARLFAAKGRSLVASSSSVILLTAPSLDDADVIEAGRELLRTWLRATALGLAACPVGAVTLVALRGMRLAGLGVEGVEPNEIVAIGESLRAEFGLREGEIPLMLLRIGRAPAPTLRSERRAVFTSTAEAA